MRPVDLVDKMFGEILSSTLKPSVVFTTSNIQPSIFDSKIGGNPYLPPNFVYPTSHTLVDQNNVPKPLLFLAQINCEQLKMLDKFPSTGMLQFFIGTDDTLGMDYEDLRNNENFRVIYHEEIISDITLLQEPPELDDSNCPYKQSMKLVEKIVDIPMNYMDYRMEKILDKLSAKYEIEEDEISVDVMFEELDTKLKGVYIPLDGTITCGGYGFFRQEDPRMNEGYEGYDIALFSSDSNDNLNWSENGVVNFFIKEESLQTKNFDEVLYFLGLFLIE
ncbi:YwqG family protein [Entamoeba marina]